MLAYTDVVPDTPKTAQLLHPGDTAQKRKDLHLGFSTYATADEIQWVKRYLFLEALAVVAPDLIGKLILTEVLAELSSADVVAHRFLTDPVQWCRDRHLTFRGEVCAWALHAARAAQGLKQHAPKKLA